GPAGRHDGKHLSLSNGWSLAPFGRRAERFHPGTQGPLSPASCPHGSSKELPAPDELGNDPFLAFQHRLACMQGTYVLASIGEGIDEEQALSCPSLVLQFEFREPRLASLIILV